MTHEPLCTASLAEAVEEVRSHALALETERRMERKAYRELVESLQNMGTPLPDMVRRNLERIGTILHGRGQPASLGD